MNNLQNEAVNTDRAVSTLRKAFIAGVALLLVASAFSSWRHNGHQKSTNMNTDTLTNSIVKKAIDALQATDKNAWFALFTSDAELYDDGNKKNFRSFFEHAIGHERFTSIDKIEDRGLSIYGHFHSDRWGDFTTYFKFRIGTAGKITRLDIGQAD